MKRDFIVIPDDVHTTLPPIANDFALSTSLIPINSFAFSNLAPYPYSSYPIIYDQLGGYSGYLPPYSFYPPGFDALHPDKSKTGGSDAGSDGSNASPDGGSNAGSSR